MRCIVARPILRINQENVKMNRPLLSKNKADAISNGAFLVILGMLIYSNNWWPWILLALWAWTGLRQLLTGRSYDFVVSTIILLGLFVISLFNIKWSILMPVLFIIGGIYIIFREYFFAQDSNGEDVAEEIKDDADTK